MNTKVAELSDVTGWQRQAPRIALLVLMGLSLAHIMATWGYSGIFWGDPGRWLHEIDRFANGEALYVDYSWPFPPLAMWLLGSIARVLGSDASVIWTATSIVFVLIMITYYLYASVLVDRTLVLPVVVSGFLLATAYSVHPLPTGTYSPAAPIGFLFLLGSTVLSLRMIRDARVREAMVLGFCCGLSILAKQDFWIPAIYLILASCSVMQKTHADRRRHLMTGMLGTFSLTLVIGLTIVAMQTGWVGIVDVALGFGHVSEFIGHSYFSWERITIEITALGIFVLGVCICLVAGRSLSYRELRRWIFMSLIITIVGGGLYLLMTYRIGVGLLNNGNGGGFATPTQGFLGKYLYSYRGIFRGSTYWLVDSLQRHIFPFVLPVGFVIYVVRQGWRGEKRRPGDTVLLVAGLCVAARLRRLVSFVEWHHILLEIPLYVAVIQDVIPLDRRKSKGLAIAVLVLAVVGAYSYWDLGVGPLTRTGTREAVETPRGWVRWRTHEARDYLQVRKVLDRVDPTGTRPLFAFGATGGFNYFLNRTNPTPLTQGFRLSPFSGDNVVNNLLAHLPRPFLIDVHSYFLTGTPSQKISLWGWELKTIENPYVRFDRPYFVKILSGCRRIAGIPFGIRPFFTLYDCESEERKTAAKR